MRRTFVGMRARAETLDRLVALQEQLLRLPREAARRVRPTPRENFHATILFVGATRDEHLEPLRAGLADAARRAAPAPRVTLSGLGAFPSSTRPRAIFADVAEGRAWLVALCESVAMVCHELGVLGERDKRERLPHVTLARIDDARPRGPLTHFVSATAAPAIGELESESLVLFESTPGEKASRYTPLHVVAMHR